MLVIIMYTLNPKAWPGPYNFIPTLTFSMSAGSALFSYAATLQVILNFNSFLFFFVLLFSAPALGRGLMDGIILNTIMETVRA